MPFVHDASAGIYVGTESVPDVEAGDLVMIQGRTGPGRFAPIVRNANITRIRHAALPNPVLIRSGRLRSNLEGSYVELAATVRSVFQVRNRFQMNLSYEGDPLPALVYSDSRTGMPQPGDLVKVRGCRKLCFQRQRPVAGAAVDGSGFRFAPCRFVPVQRIRANCLSVKSGDCSRIPGNHQVAIRFGYAER